MRVIDADELISILEWNKGQEKDALVSINSLIKLIGERPTAYEPNKVAKELNELRTKEENYIKRIVNDVLDFSKSESEDNNFMNEAARILLYATVSYVVEFMSTSTEGSSVVLNEAENFLETMSTYGPEETDKIFSKISKDSFAYENYKSFKKINNNKIEINVIKYCRTLLEIYCEK